MKLSPMRVGIVVLTLLVLQACGSSGKTRDEALDSTGGITDPDANATGVVVEGATGTKIDPDSVAGRAPENRTIYFDFDIAEVRSEYLAVVAEHGRYLAQNPEGRVRLEGHTDERGTREYNVALGESRAKAVGRMLQLQGVSSAQFRAVSYGEELPAEEGQTEAAYDANRRVQIVYESE